MQNNISLFRLAFFLFSLAPLFGFGQTLTESFQKLAWRESAAPSSYYWESKLPAADCTAIRYLNTNEIETFDLNAEGLPESCILSSLENGQMRPLLKSEVEYSAWGHVSNLQIWHWENDKWERDMQFRRSFDASGMDQSFVVETWQTESWKVLEEWKKPSPIVSEAVFTAAAMRP